MRRLNGLNAQRRSLALRFSGGEKSILDFRRCRCCKERRWRLGGLIDARQRSAVACVSAAVAVAWARVWWWVVHCCAFLLDLTEMMVRRHSLIVAVNNNGLGWRARARQCRRWCGSRRCTWWSIGGDGQCLGRSMLGSPLRRVCSGRQLLCWGERERGQRWKRKKKKKKK